MFPQLSTLSAQTQSGLFACVFLLLFFLLWAKKNRGNFFLLVFGCAIVLLVSLRWDLVVHGYQFAQGLLAKGGH